MVRWLRRRRIFTVALRHRLRRFSRGHSSPVHSLRALSRMGRLLRWELKQTPRGLVLVAALRLRFLRKSRALVVGGGFPSPMVRALLRGPPTLLPEAANTTPLPLPSLLVRKARLPATLTGRKWWMV